MWRTAPGKLFHTTGLATQKALSPNFRPRTRNKVVCAGRRAESIACRITVAVGVYRISQVVWALMCVDCEYHQCQLELDSVHHWQPVQLPQGRTHVIAPGRDVQLRSAPAEEVQWWPAADHSESRCSSLVGWRQRHWLAVSWHQRSHDSSAVWAYAGGKTGTQQNLVSIQPSSHSCWQQYWELPTKHAQS